MQITSPWFLTVLDSRVYDPEGYRYSVCFVNQSNKTIQDIRYVASGVINPYGKTSSVSSEEREIGDLKPHHVVEIEQIQQNGFKESLQYDFYVNDENEEIHCRFSIPRNLQGTVHSINELPVVQQWGHVFLPQLIK